MSLKSVGAKTQEWEQGLQGLPLSTVPLPKPTAWDTLTWEERKPDLLLDMQFW